MSPRAMPDIRVGDRVVVVNAGSGYSVGIMAIVRDTDVGDACLVAVEFDGPTMPRVYLSPRDLQIVHYGSDREQRVKASELRGGLR